MITAGGWLATRYQALYVPCSFQGPTGMADDIPILQRGKVPRVTAVNVGASVRIQAQARCQSPGSQQTTAPPTVNQLVHSQSPGLLLGGLCWVPRASYTLWWEAGLLSPAPGTFPTFRTAPSPPPPHPPMVNEAEKEKPRPIRCVAVCRN